MNQDQPYPDENDPVSRIEQRLNQLRPRPVSFDAKSVLRGAGAADTQVSLPGRPTPKSATGRGRWLTVAASWMCGAVAGVVLTWLVLHPGKADAPTTGPQQAASDDANTSTTSAMKDVHRERKNESHSDRFPESRHPSDGKRFVYAPLLELRRPQETSDLPLMARSYAFPSLAPRSKADMPDFSSAQRLTSSANTDEGSPKTSERPPLSVNADLLLEELLGARPGSRL